MGTGNRQVGNGQWVTGVRLYAPGAILSMGRGYLLVAGWLALDCWLLVGGQPETYEFIGMRL